MKKLIPIVSMSILAVVVAKAQDPAKVDGISVCYGLCWSLMFAVRPRQ